MPPFFVKIVFLVPCPYRHPPSSHHARVEKRECLSRLRGKAKALLGDAPLGQDDGLDAPVFIKTQIFHADMPAAIPARLAILHVRAIVVEEIPLALELHDGGMDGEAILRRAREQTSVSPGTFQRGAVE